MKTLLTEKQVASAVDRLYKAVVKQLPKDMPLAVVGIRTRGETLAQRLVDKLRKAKPDQDIAYGILDITFYRDDLSRRSGVPVVRATEIDFDLNDACVMLVDDVLQTGRSIRAALDALHDFGRPKMIKLIVLIDRGGHELPIAADIAAKTVTVPPGKKIQVKLKENDGEEGVFIIPSDS